MFRRRKTNEAAEKKNAIPTPPPPPMEQASPLSKNPTGMWYKKPQGNTPKPHAPVGRGDQRRSLGMAELPSQQKPQHHHHHHNQRDHRRSIGHIPEPTSHAHHAPFQVPEYNAGNNRQTYNGRAPPAASAHRGSTANRRISGGTGGTDSDKTDNLCSILSKGIDWNAARSLMEQDPSCIRQKQTLLILGNRTTAYPIHLAVCTQAPMPVLDKLLSSFPSSIQLPDDYNGRLPLHWACIAGASPPVLQKLMGLHLAACKATDKIYGRLPLHYICMHASSLAQVSVVLEADHRGLAIKDKQSKTPLDLAQESSNPLKLDIISLLQKRRNSKSASRHSNSKMHEDAKRAGIYDEWETPMTVNVNKPPAPPDHSEYQVPAYGGMTQPSPGFRNSAKKANPVSSNKKGVPKPPNTGGFFMDRTMLRPNHMQREDSDRLSVEDPGPRTHTDPELRPVPMDRSETWSAGSSEGDDVRRSLQDKLMKNAFDFRSDPIPLDPMSQPALTSKSKYQKRQSAPISIPPTHATRKLKPPPQQQPQHDIIRNADPRHQLPPNSSRPTTKRQSDPVQGSQPRSTSPPNPPNYHQHTRRSEPMGSGGGGLQATPPRSKSPPQPHKNKPKRRSGPYPPTCSESGGVTPPAPTERTPSQNLRDYYRRHEEKVSAFEKKPGVTHERGPPPTKKEEETKGRDLVNGMNSNIRQLSSKITQWERDLAEKDSQLADLDSQIGRLDATEMDLSRDFDMAKSTARQNQDTVRQKQNRISELARQIQQLQVELRAEENDVQAMERNMRAYQDTADRTGDKLKSLQDEKGNLGAIRQAVDEERACIARDIDNSTCELKSLEAIQNLAMRGDDL